jgi:hypothetical protein
MSSPDPKKTYAVVVGIERYNKSPNLPGAASSSLKFATWLSNLSVPHDNILLFISELDDNKTLFEDCNFNNNEATSSNIFKGFFEQINQKSGDLLYIFWAGHGFIDDINSRRLSYSDDNKNFNLSSLLKSLTTKTFPNFNKQIILIDACAIYATKTSSKHFYGEQLYEEKYPVGGVKNNNSQVVLLATKAGHTAKYNSEENTGLFSKVLLEELQKKGKLLFPEEMREIQENVVNIFQQKYSNEQNPISLYSIDEDGNQIGLNQSAINSNFLEQQYNKLSKIIDDIEWNIIKSICYEILLQFSNDPQGSYSELSKPNNFPYLKDIFLNIQHKDNYQVDIKLMLAFAYNLSQSTEQAILDKKLDLETWINKTKESFSITEDTFNNLIQIIPKNQNTSNDNDIYKKGYPYLLIICEPVINKLTAELVFQNNDNEKSIKYNINFEQIDIDTNTDYKNTCKRIYHLLNQVKKILNRDCNNSHELTIELFLPNQYLIKFALEIEEMPLLPNETEPLWFGYEYKLVTRSYNRFQDYSLYDKFSRKWDELHQLTEINQKIVCFNKDKLNQQHNWKKFRDTVTRDMAQTKISINMNVPLLNAEYNHHIDEFLVTILRCGFPFSFWLRNGSLESLKLKEDTTINQFEDIFTIDDLKNTSKLFKLIKDVRRDAYIEDETKHKQYLGYHLGFLFDNPHRLPSKFDLEKGGDSLIFG